jgi:hypothetical protein
MGRDDNQTGVNPQQQKRIPRKVEKGGGSSAQAKPGSEDPIDNIFVNMKMGTKIPTMITQTTTSARTEARPPAPPARPPTQVMLLVQPPEQVKLPVRK